LPEESHSTGSAAGFSGEIQNPKAVPETRNTDGWMNPVLCAVSLSLSCLFLIQIQRHSFKTHNMILDGVRAITTGDGQRARALKECR